MLKFLATLKIQKNLDQKIRDIFAGESTEITGVKFQFAILSESFYQKRNNLKSLTYMLLEFVTKNGFRINFADSG